MKNQFFNSLFTPQQYHLILVFVLFITSCQTNQKKENNNEPAVEVDSIKTKFNKLVWSDEFDGDGAIDTTKWFQQTKLPPGGSWWGGLIQHYTNRIENTYVRDGNMYLMAKKETFEDQGETKEYTSARLNSIFAFSYGRIEIRAKMPTGVGTWPAIWMLNKNINEDGAYWYNQGFGEVNWPICGEIDILEHWGKQQNIAQSAVHTESSYGYHVINKGEQVLEDMTNQFHIYSLEWSKEKMIFSVDGKVHYEYNPEKRDNSTWPFDMDYYLILNIAIEPDISEDFVESPMVVDYVRVYQ